MFVGCEAEAPPVPVRYAYAASFPPTGSEWARESMHLEPLPGFTHVKLTAPPYLNTWVFPGVFVGVLHTEPGPPPRTVDLFPGSPCNDLLVLEARADEIVVLATPEQAATLAGARGERLPMLCNEDFFFEDEPAHRALFALRDALGPQLAPPHRALRPGPTRPDPTTVSVQAWIDGSPYTDPPPSGGPFSVLAEVAPSPWTLDAEIVRVTVRAEGLPPSRAEWTFVLDASASMFAHLSTVAGAADHVLAALDPRDPVSLVRAGVETELVFSRVPAGQSRAILDAITETRAQDRTALAEGLRAGCDIGGRVVLWTDALVTLTDADRAAIAEAADGCDVVAAVVGAGDERLPWLEALATDTAYVAFPSDGRRLWAAHLQSSGRYADPEVRVTFDAAAVDWSRRVGEGGAEALEDPGATHTALYEIHRRLPWWRLGRIEVETGWGAGLPAGRQSWRLPARVAPRLSADGRVAVAAASLALELAESPNLGLDLGRVYAIADVGRPAYQAEDLRLKEDIEWAAGAIPWGTRRCSYPMVVLEGGEVKSVLVDDLGQICR